jgi:hypothetical protein
MHQVSVSNDVGAEEAQPLEPLINSPLDASIEGIGRVIVPFRALHTPGAVLMSVNGELVDVDCIGDLRVIKCPLEVVYGRPIVDNKELEPLVELISPGLKGLL